MKKPFQIVQLKTINKKVAQEIYFLMKQHIINLKPLTINYLRKLIKNKAVKVFIALNPQKNIVGTATMISYRKIDGVFKVYVEDVVVDVNYRRKGIGTALINKIIKTAKKMKADTIHLTSNPKRIAANLLYQKIGFKIYETNYYKYNLNSSNITT